MLRSFFLYLFCCVLTNQLLAQSVAADQEVWMYKIDQYGRAHHQEVLFLHTDKTIYTNNETIWFTAYLLKALPEQLAQHEFLPVSLIREDNREVVLHYKYLLNQGWSTGSISLPDSIAPGNYQLVATTNIVNEQGDPVVVFAQPLTIRSIKTPNIHTTLALLDTIVNNGMIRARVTVAYPYDDGKRRKTARLEYNVGKDAVKSVTLRENEYIISIPAEKLNELQPVLFTSIKYDGDIQHLSVPLPAIRSDEISVRFFPEGGYLVNGLASRVGWEARTSYKQSIAVTAILYKDDKPIDTLITNQNGIGAFSLIPDRSSRYFVKVPANEYLKKDTSFALPVIIEDGIVLKLAEAVINDTLQVELHTQQPRKVQVLVHNYRETYAEFTISLKSLRNRVTIALPVIQKGVAMITILDEHSRPLAERLFFGGYDQKINTTITSDKEVYEKIEKVNVQLQLTNTDMLPAEGLVSVAVVQSNRIESEKWQDMESYLYLEHDLGRIPQNGGKRNLYNKEYLEEVLLVKGWRRYTWQSLASDTPDSSSRIALPPITATVTYRDNPLKEDISVVIMRDSVMDFMSTIDRGQLRLSPEDLFVKEGRKVFALVAEKNKQWYQVHAEYPSEKLHQQLSELMEVEVRGRLSAVQRSQENWMRGMESAAMLQTVVVTAKKDHSIFGMRGIGSNACGDYVCSYNILNCPNHFNNINNKPPQPYQQYNLPGGGTILYQDCIGEKEAGTPVLKGVYAAREFYGVEPDDTQVQGPQLLSTLFWKPDLIVDSNGKAAFSFYTSDIAGRFRIMVQGVGDREEAIVGEYFFEVK